jgi:hypothetical protein
VTEFQVLWKDAQMKNIAHIMIGAALVFAPVAADAQHGGGHGGGHVFVGGGGPHGGYWGGYGHGGYGGGYRWGGYRAYYRGGYGGPWYWGGWPYHYYYGPALGVYLGYYATPWFWGYPAYYYGYPVYPYPPAMNVTPGYPDSYYDQSGQSPPTAQQPSQAPVDCGHWQWDPTRNQYLWIPQSCR